MYDYIDFTDTKLQKRLTKQLAILTPYLDKGDKTVGLHFFEKNEWKKLFVFLDVAWRMI